MTRNHEIVAQSRKDEGKGASRRLRHASFVPAVVYGAGQPPESIQIEHNTILLAAKQERSEEHTSELQSLMRISYAVFCLKKKNPHQTQAISQTTQIPQKHSTITP